MPNSTALHVFTVYCFGYITPAPASVLTGYKINMLRPRFSTVAPKLELLPCPNTKGLCRVVSTLLCRLKHRRHHIEMQSLCFAKGAIATWIFSFTIRYFQESSNRNLASLIRRTVLLQAGSHWSP